MAHVYQTFFTALVWTIQGQKERTNKAVLHLLLCGKRFTCRILIKSILRAQQHPIYNVLWYVVRGLLLIRNVILLTSSWTVCISKHVREGRAQGQVRLGQMLQQIKPMVFQLRDNLTTQSGPQMSTP